MESESPWADDMLQLVQEISDDLPPEAEALFRDDPESLEIYLGSEAFLEDLLAWPDPLNIEPETFFYILFRQFRRKLETHPSFQQRFRKLVSETAGDVDRSLGGPSFFEDRELIVYLVDLLRQFVRREDVYQLPTDPDREYRYVFEMLEASLDSNDHETFQIYRHVGNYSLYLTGLFPDWIRHRHRYKDRPMDVDSYRDYGKTFYERAANHRQAEDRQLRTVLNKLNRGYDLVRGSLELIFKELIPAFQ